MWILYAIFSSFFAGVTAILAKCGIKKTNSNVATALRTIFVLIFAWCMVFIVNSQNDIFKIKVTTWIFLILSGLTTGASWLCYYKALQLGNVTKVVPIDKLSTILTIILAFIVLQEKITIGKIMGIILITIGTFLMIQKPKEEVILNKNKSWLLFAILSAIFASFTAILGKLGIDGVESNLGTAIRTTIVLVMAWIVVFVSKQQHTIKNISKKEMIFIILSSIATGASWLCYYKALQDGVTSIVVSIDKLSILVTILFSFIFLKEKISIKAWIGLFLMISGTLFMIFIF